MFGVLFFLSGFFYLVFMFIVIGLILWILVFLVIFNLGNEVIIVWGFLGFGFSF